MYQRTFFYDATNPSVPESPHNWSLTIALRHTTLGTTFLDKESARRRDLYL